METKRHSAVSAKSEHLRINTVHFQRRLKSENEVEE